MSKLTTERLEYYAELPTQPAEGDGFFKKGIFMYEVRRMARQLLAYEQAAKNPAAKIEWDGSEFSVNNVSSEFYYGTTDVYLAPVLPKQQSIKLPSTRMWAGVIECYEKNEIIAAIKSAGYEVSND